jgi:hypothetical protein
MKTLLKTIIASTMVLALSATVASADAKKGQKFYLKKLKVCKKDGLKNGAVFATKHDRKTWASLKKSGTLMDEWKTICPSGVKKFGKMKEKHINNLYDFVWKYASDGDVPSCG